MQPWLRNIGETVPFFHHPHSWLLHTCQAPTTGHCFRLSLFLLPLQFSSNCKLTCYVWRGNQGFTFGDFVKWVLGTWNFRDSVRTQLPPWKCNKRSNHSSRCCSTFCCSSRRETTSWMHFIQFSRETVLRWSLSSNFLFQERLLFGCISSKFLSQRETFILDAFHPILLSKRDSFMEAFHPIFSSKERLFCGCLSSNFLFQERQLHGYMSSNFLFHGD